MLLGLLIDWDLALLALPLDQGGSAQEADELIWRIRCWTLCLVYACGEGVSTDLELRSHNRVEESTSGGEMGGIPVPMELYLIIQCNQ